MTREGIASMSQPTTTTPAILGLAHFAFVVRDLDASIAWYQKVFDATLVEGEFPHYGRPWTGFAKLVIEPNTGIAIGLHHNVANQHEEFSETRTGLDHISLRVDGHEGLNAWQARLDSLGVAHSGIQSVKDPIPFSTLIFRDIDNIQLEFYVDDI
jgi:glyoxylase I family protein